MASATVNPLCDLCAVRILASPRVGAAACGWEADALRCAQHGGLEATAARLAAPPHFLACCSRTHGGSGRLASTWVCVAVPGPAGVVSDSRPPLDCGLHLTRRAAPAERFGHRVLPRRGKGARPAGCFPALPAPRRHSEAGRVSGGHCLLPSCSRPPLAPGLLRRLRRHVPWPGRRARPLRAGAGCAAGAVRGGRVWRRPRRRAGGSRTGTRPAGGEYTQLTLR